MTDTIHMTGTNIDVEIPLTDLPKLVVNFYKIIITSNTQRHNITLDLNWEEDSESIIGYIKQGELIVLDKEQYGSFKNSMCGGLDTLLKEYKGSGIIRITDEDGEVEVTKYINGSPKQGKVIFE